MRPQNYALERAAAGIGTYHPVIVWLLRKRCKINYCRCIQWKYCASLTVVLYSAGSCGEVESDFSYVRLLTAVREWGWMWRICGGDTSDHSDIRCYMPSPLYKLEVVVLCKDKRELDLMAPEMPLCDSKICTYYVSKSLGNWAFMLPIRSLMYWFPPFSDSWFALPTFCSLIRHFLLNSSHLILKPHHQDHHYISFLR
jgi:hypothetical protein